MNEVDTSLREDDLSPWELSRVKMIARVLSWLEAQPKFTKALQGAAAELSARLSVLEGAAGREISAKSLERLYYRWRNAGRNWRTLVDRRTMTANKSRSRTGQRCFIAHLHLLASRHDRTLIGAIEELKKEWDTGKPVPGYEGVARVPGVYPTGWSEDNLRRKLPTKGELTIMKDGTRAGYAALPQVFATREGCWPCSHVLFDDVWLNIKVLGYDGNGEIQLNRPLQLGALDLYTGKRLSWGTKLRTKTEDGRSLQLNSDEMIFLLCDYFYTVGYSPRGTVLVVENGTAAISKRVEDMITALTEGLVTVDRSGHIGGRQVSGPEGRVIGNPRHKAALEVWHSLLQNKMDALPLQTGNDRTEPEKLWGETREAEALIKAGKELSPERALALMPNALTLSELADKLAIIVGEINGRTDHDLEGWERCGFTVPEFSVTGAAPWTPLAAMDPAAREAAEMISKATPRTLRLRKMSPNEAWEMSTKRPENRLIRFTPAQCVALMGAHRKFKIIAKGGAFRINSRARHHEQLLFESCIRTIDGAQRELPAGVPFYGIFNPLSGALFVLDERDKVLGEAMQIHRCPHADQAAKLRQFGRRRARMEEELDRIENALAPDRVEHEIRVGYNADVMEGRPFEPLGLMDARTQKKAAGRKPAYISLIPAEEPAGLGLTDDGDVGTFPNL